MSRWRKAGRLGRGPIREHLAFFLSEKADRQADTQRWDTTLDAEYLSGKMFIGNLLVTSFAICGAFRPSRRGEFAPNPGGADPNLEEGDIAETGNPLGSGEGLNSFVTATARLWPRGIVYYRIETDEWEGVAEPVFLDEQVATIKQALRQIERGVPCIDFRSVTFERLL